MKIGNRLLKKDIEELNKLMPEIPKKEEIKKERPLAYKIYGYLKKNCVGYKKRVKSDVLMREFEITDNKTLRSYIQEIRESQTLTKIICSEAGMNGGYWIATSQKDVNQTLDHLYKRSMEMLKSYAILKRKAKLNKQMRIKLGKYEKEIIESIIEEEYHYECMECGYEWESNEKYNICSYCPRCHCGDLHCTDEDGNEVVE